MSTIIAEIFEEISLSEEELSFLDGKMKRIDLKKGELLLKADEDIDDIFYVHAGCLRSYFIDGTGKEHILQFAIKGWWVSDYIALFGFQKIKSVSYIECIKDSEIYSISKTVLDDICVKLPKVANFHLGKMEKGFASFQNRILENLTLPAKDRYLNFVKTYPDIERNVKNYHIASYLGITTESLSRIRKEISLS